MTGACCSLPHVTLTVELNEVKLRVMTEHESLVSGRGDEHPRSKCGAGVSAADGSSDFSSSANSSPVMSHRGVRGEEAGDDDDDVGGIGIGIGGVVGENRCSEPEQKAAEHVARRLSKLSVTMGFALSQHNGQRRFAAIDVATMTPPGKGTEVFVARIPRDVYEDELVPLFVKVGPIYEFRLMMDFGGSNRGYGYCRYLKADAAQRAVKELNNFEIRKNAQLGVVFSMDNRRLYVRGLPKSRSREEVKTELMSLTEGVRDVIIFPSVSDKARNRGFAFIEYYTHKDAAMGRRALCPPGKVQILGSNVVVDWAEPEVEIDPEIMKNVKGLFARNFQIATTEEEISEGFKLLAGTAPERVRKRRDYAFVHFSERSHALRALESSAHPENLQRAFPKDQDVEVEWAKPVSCKRQLGLPHHQQQSLLSRPPGAAGFFPHQAAAHLNLSSYRGHLHHGGPGILPPPSSAPALSNFLFPAAAAAALNPHHGGALAVPQFHHPNPYQQHHHHQQQQHGRDGPASQNAGGAMLGNPAPWQAHVPHQQGQQQAAFGLSQLMAAAPSMDAWYALYNAAGSHSHPYASNGAPLRNANRTPAGTKGVMTEAVVSNNKLHNSSEANQGMKGEHGRNESRRVEYLKGGNRIHHGAEEKENYTLSTARSDSRGMGITSDSAIFDEQNGPSNGSSTKSDNSGVVTMGARENSGDDASPGAPAPGGLANACPPPPAQAYPPPFVPAAPHHQIYVNGGYPQLPHDVGQLIQQLTATSIHHGAGDLAAGHGGNQQQHQQDGGFLVSGAAPPPEQAGNNGVGPDAVGPPSSLYAGYYPTAAPGPAPGAWGPAQYNYYAQLQHQYPAHQMAGRGYAAGIGYGAAEFYAAAAGAGLHHEQHPMD